MAPLTIAASVRPTQISFIAAELQFNLVIAASPTQDTDSLHIIFVSSKWREIYMAVTQPTLKTS